MKDRIEQYPERFVLNNSIYVPNYEEARILDLSYLTIYQEYTGYSENIECPVLIRDVNIFVSSTESVYFGLAYLFYIDARIQCSYDTSYSTLRPNAHPLLMKTLNRTGRLDEGMTIYNLSEFANLYYSNPMSYNVLNRIVNEKHAIRFGLYTSLENPLPAVVRATMSITPLIKLNFDEVGSDEL